MLKMDSQVRPERSRGFSPPGFILGPMEDGRVVVVEGPDAASKLALEAADWSFPPICDEWFLRFREEYLDGLSEFALGAGLPPVDDFAKAVFVSVCFDLLDFSQASLR